MPAPAQAVMYGERLQINPGSATGAYSGLTPDVRPSFVLMDVDGTKVRGARRARLRGRCARGAADAGRVGMHVARRPGGGAFRGARAARRGSPSPARTCNAFGLHGSLASSDSVCKYGTVAVSPRAWAQPLLRNRPTNRPGHPTPRAAQATVYVYQLVDNAVKVEKIDYQKPGSPVTL